MTHQKMKNPKKRFWFSFSFRKPKEPKESDTDPEAKEENEATDNEEQEEAKAEESEEPVTDKALEVPPSEVKEKKERKRWFTFSLKRKKVAKKETPSGQSQSSMSEAESSTDEVVDEVPQPSNDAIETSPQLEANQDNNELSSTEPPPEKNNEDESKLEPESKNAELPLEQTSGSYDEDSSKSFDVGDPSFEFPVIESEPISLDDLFSESGRNWLGDSQEDDENEEKTKDESLSEAEFDEIVTNADSSKEDELEDEEQEELEEQETERKEENEEEEATENEEPKELSIQEPAQDSDSEEIAIQDSVFDGDSEEVYAHPDEFSVLSEEISVQESSNNVHETVRKPVVLDPATEVDIVPPSLEMILAAKAPEPPPLLEPFSEEDIEIPTMKVVTSWSKILSHYLYPTLLMVFTGIFATYSLGYHNFSTYLLSSVLLTVLIINLSYGLFNILKNLSNRALGVREPEKAWVKLSRERSLQLYRTLNVILGVFVFLLVTGLLFEVWKVPGGFRAIGKIVNTPFLTVQKTRLSFWSILKFVGVLSVSIWLSGYLKRTLKETLYSMMDLHLGTQHAINTTVSYIIIIVGVLVGLQVMGMSIGVLAVFAGVIGIGVGFGMQNVANNFISGLLITYGRPVSVGDVVEVGDVYGIVRKISARSTTLETVDSRIILVPNADILTNQVINWSKGPKHIWVNVELSVAYTSNIRVVQSTLLDVAKREKRVLKKPSPYVRFDNFGEYALEFCLMVAIRNPMDKEKLLSLLRFKVKEEFDKKGIEMPVPRNEEDERDTPDSYFGQLYPHQNVNKP